MCLTHSFTVAAHFYYSNSGSWLLDGALKTEYWKIYLKHRF